MIKTLVLLILVLIPIHSISQNKVYVLSYNINNPTDKQECKEWTPIPQKYISKLFSLMVPLPGAEHHCCYNNFSCGIYGKIIFNGKKYNYSLNAGGWAELYSKDFSQQFMLACKTEKYFKYFITVYDNPSDYNK